MYRTITSHRWWCPETRSDPGRPHRGVNPAALADPPAAPIVHPQRMREASTELRAWVTDLRGGFDAGSGRAFDGLVESGFLANWLEQDEHEHNKYLFELGLRITDADKRVNEAETTVQDAEKGKGNAEQECVDARTRLAGKPLNRTDHPAGKIRGLNYRDPALLAGRPRFELLMWLFVIGAVAGDFAAFYSVLEKLFRAQMIVVWAGTIGFSAAAIGICHLIGVGLRRRRARDPQRNDVLLWAQMAGWLALGAVAFVARVHFGVPGSTSFGSQPTASDGTRDLLAALVFAGLYAVSGLLAMTVSFHTFNPADRAYRQALRNLKKCAEEVRNAHMQRVEGLARQKVLADEKSRAPERLAAAERRTKADVAWLQYEARRLMAAELHDPEALEMLMREAPEMPRDPGSEGTS